MPAAVEVGVEVPDRAFVRAELDERVRPGVQTPLHAFRHLVVLHAAVVEQVSRAAAVVGVGRDMFGDAA